MMSADEVMGLAPVVPVLVLDDPETAAPLAEALTDGGLLALEVTLRTPSALEAIRAMARSAPRAVIGAGTVLNRKMLLNAVDAGARFIVSPGLSEGLVSAAREAEVPLLAGVATASEILMGLDLGLDRFKFFPAQTSGGPAAVSAFGGPFAGVAFCPTGGVSLANAPDYLGLANVRCVGGSWVAPREAVEAKDWARIRDLAAEAARLKR